MKEEERAGQIETLASFELSQMTPILNLTDQQKDPFFQAIAAAQQSLLDPQNRKKFTPSHPSKDALRYAEIQNEAKLEAVKAILTPEQWEIYRGQLESRARQQQEMMKAFLPK